MKKTKLLIMRFLAVASLLAIGFAVYGLLNPEACEVVTGCGVSVLCEGLSLNPEYSCSGVKTFVSVPLLLVGMVSLAFVIKKLSSVDNV